MNCKKFELNFEFSILLIICFSFNDCHIHREEEELYCGAPAIPTGGKLFVIHKVDGNDTLEPFNIGDEAHFPHKTRIWYHCEYGVNGLLIGDEYRHCNDGRWSGQVPMCLKVARSNLTTQIEVTDLESNNTPVVQTLGQISGKDSWFKIRNELCLGMNMSQTHQWSIKMTSPTGDPIVQLNYLSLFFNGPYIKDFYTRNRFGFDITLNSSQGVVECKLNENQYLKLPEDNSPDHLQLTYLCYDDFDSTDGDLNEINIKFNQKNSIDQIYQFSLCQIKRYSGLRLCPKPDSPCGGFIEKKIDIDTTKKLTTYNFKCHKNYNLTGLEQVRCNKFGEWLDLKPVCVPQYCRKLRRSLLAAQNQTKLIAGYEVDKEAYAEHIPYAKWLIFSCGTSDDSQTLVIENQSKYTCDNGQWTGLDMENLPKCVPGSTFHGLLIIIALSSVILFFIVIVVIIIRLFRQKTKEIRQLSEKVRVQSEISPNLYGKGMFEDVYDDANNEEYQDIDLTYNPGVYETLPDYDDVKNYTAMTSV